MKTVKRDNYGYDRRTFVKSVLFGTGALLTFPSLLSLTSCQASPSKRPLASPDFRADIEIGLIALPDRVQILPGNKTKVWRYRASVLKGPESTVQNLTGTFTGPVFRFRKGQKVRIFFKNKLPEESIVHWHGLHVPEIADGHPRFVINKGETFVYEFEIENRAGTYWFHPHPHGRTGPQVYNGLAGLFLITDDEEQALDLPSGEYDVPVVIQDRTFNKNNNLVYLRNRMDRMTGFLGERILVNGNPDVSMKLKTGTYRFRVLNGSNSRIYKLAWSDGTPLTAIATDGGLLDKPVQKRYIMLGPAERVDLWVDLSDRKPGDIITLKSLAFDGGSMGGMRGGMMGGGMMGGSTGGNGSVPGNGDKLDLLKVNITEGKSEQKVLPSTLSALNFLDPDDVVNKNDPRTFRFSMQGMNPVINGRTFKMTKVASDEIVKLNTTEVWRIVNENSGMMGGMMQMPHPVHIHGLSFRILNRTRSSSGWSTVNDGFIDNGWKDTVLLMPGMQADVLLRFEDYPGLFLYHCHNLEHEDLGMMRNYLVK